ncbi:MAG: V-type ATP synthase subunit K [Candidatus Coatesbacteria bacterium]|jgi:V/A-type H+-transporting ATPase subunit K|nr:V-type ATP synthase subunit K [Candidatus Coatesbacteria bacterium]
MGLVWSYLGAALAVALAGIGSAIGIGYVGQAASGVMSEDPRNFGKYLVLTALPGTQGIYGFVAGFLVLNKIGALGQISPELGLQIFLASLPIALAGLFSAIHQGKVCTSGVGLTAKQPSESGKALVLGVFVEFYAVLGLLLTIFLLNAIG